MTRYVLILLEGSHVESKLTFPSQHMGMYIAFITEMAADMAGGDVDVGRLHSLVREALNGLPHGDNKKYIDISVGPECGYRIRCKRR